MHKVKIIFTAIILTVIPSILIAQNNTDSPYSRYGYGNLADKAFAAQRGMGGIGYGVRNSKIINPMNPASYSNVDSMTFMIDLGIMGQSGWYKDSNKSDQRYNANLEYVAIQFPLIKKMGMGIGLEPVSHVGYNYGDYEELSGGDEYATNVYRGSGGFSKVYTTLSYEFFDRLSLGVKLSYLFGDLKYNRTTSFTTSTNYSTIQRDTLRMGAFLYDIGVQYRQPIGNNKSIVFGAVYTPKIKTNAKYSTTQMIVDASSSTIQSSTSETFRDSIFEMPESFAFGATFNRAHKYIIGADVLFEKWSEAKYYDQTNGLFDRLKFNIGGEYIPNISGQNYFQRVRYRGGAYYADSYLKVKDAGYKEYGITAGFGLPLTDRRSFINLAFEYSMVKPDSDFLIDEKYFRITISYTFNELWFIKRKLQ